MSSLPRHSGEAATAGARLLRWSVAVLTTALSVPLVAQQVTSTRIEPAAYPAWKRFCEEADSAFSLRLLVRP